MHPRRWFAVAAILGSLAVALGAFGAHSLPKRLESLGLDATTADERIELFETAVKYQMFAALALCGFALAADRWPARGWAVASSMLAGGAVIFCGVLYGLVVVEGSLRSILGMTAPVGGSLMIAGWAVAAWTASREAPLAD